MKDKTISTLLRESFEKPISEDIFSFCLGPPENTLAFEYVNVDDETIKQRFEFATYTIKKLISIHELEKDKKMEANAKAATTIDNSAKTVARVLLAKLARDIRNPHSLLFNPVETAKAIYICDCVLSDKPFPATFHFAASNTTTDTYDTEQLIKNHD